MLRGDGQGLSGQPRRKPRNLRNSALLGTCYGRDAMSAPLRELVSVIRSVASGAFSPDESKSGQFVGVCASDAGASSQPHFSESEASREDTVGAFDKEPSSSSSDSECSSDTESIPDEGRIRSRGLVGSYVGTEGRMARFGDVFENPNSRKLHLRQPVAPPWHAAALRRVYGLGFPVLAMSKDHDH